MADSIDIKSKNKQENLDAELDAMLDEAELSLSTVDNHQTNDDVIDKLLLDAEFDFNEASPVAVDDSVLLADFDDDFDLADISTNPQTSDTGTRFVDELGSDSDFPLDLLDSIASTTNEQKNAFIKTDDDEDLPIVRIQALQDKDEIGITDEIIPFVEDNHFINKLDEFSDFDEFGDFQDFQNSEKVEDVDTDSVFSEAVEMSEYDDITEQEPPSLGPIVDEKDLVIDVADLPAIDETINYDEFSDEFDDLDSITPFSAPVIKMDESGQVQNKESLDGINTENTSTQDDFDITAGIDDYFSDSLDQENQQFQEIEQESALSKASIDQTIVHQSDDMASLIEAAGIPSLIQFKSDQENLNRKHKKQIGDFEANAKKSSLIIYVSLGIGITSTIAAAVLGFLVYSTKTDMSKLTAQLAALEQGLTNNNTAKNPNHDQQALSLNPLPDKVDEKVPPVQAKTEAPIKEMKLEPSPAATSHETENSSLEPKSATLEVQQEAALTIEKSRESNEPQKVESAIEPREASPQIENKVVEPQKETIQALEKKPDMSEPLKSPADALEKQSLSSEEKTTTLAHKPFEELKNKKGIIENKLKNTVRTKTESIKIKKKYASTSSNWSVNLIAYKQQWYASSKANEFIEKGVPVEIIPVKVDNVTWFRLRVGGFVDREEASVYAGRIKKALNLSSVWVGNK